MTGKKISTFQERLNIAIERSGKTQAAIAADLGMSKQAISTWVNGQFSPKKPAIVTLASYFGTSVPWLMGFDVPQNETVKQEYQHIKNIVPIRTMPIRFLGSVAAGEPIFDQAEYDAIVPCDANVKCDFALRVKGNSMFPIYQSGDTVFVRETPTVGDGEIAVVFVGDEATIKRVYRKPDGLALISENPDHPPMHYAPDECEQIRIAGKPVAFFRKV